MATDQQGEEPLKNTKEFLRLLTAHDHETFVYILTLTPNWSDAEDIAQEVRVRLWEQYAKRYESGTDFAAWARTIAWYLVLAHRKQAKKRHVLLGDELLEQLSVDFQVAADQPPARQQALGKCVEQLAEERRVMLQKYYGGATLQELATVAGTSAAAVRKVLFRARLALAQCIDRALRAEEETS